MVTIERRKRSGPVLTPSKLPCLGNMPTINITEGCAHGCCYCYTRGYARFPGDNRIVLFDNIPELVKNELKRKRKPPRRVYFSPSSDAFQPLSDVLDVTYRTMTTLLERGIEVAFLTKGDITPRFIDLFSRFPRRVFAQVGLTTLDERLWRIIEPGSAPPQRRLQCIEKLAQLGIKTRARLDPLIPDVTDTEERLKPLLRELAQRNIKGISASYLFFRPSFERRIAQALRLVCGKMDISNTWVWRRFADGVGGGQMVDTHERQIRFSKLKKLASEAGMELCVCACKNPDINIKQSCQIAGETPSEHHRDLPLFTPLNAKNR